MASIITCLACKNPMIFPSPKLERGKSSAFKVTCTNCGAVYSGEIKQDKGPDKKFTKVGPT